MTSANWHWLRHVHPTLLDAVGTPLGTVLAARRPPNTAETVHSWSHGRAPSGRRGAAGPKMTEVPIQPGIGSSLMHLFMMFLMV